MRHIELQQRITARHNLFYLVSRLGTLDPVQANVQVHDRRVRLKSLLKEREGGLSNVTAVQVQKAELAVLVLDPRGKVVLDSFWPQL